ncbi:GFA family protein [Marinobacter koreensis]|uniref:GFA family protein n=1 Tax=Marinobacter koreensis TaxID=335974 RepID=A0ABW0RGQ6_9GAMM|nr:GFA family protein [Marinobacter koreensis]MCK7548207.1 GFA family protein [Marinobacter koreensis]MDX1818729.1 GFA family protein [Marinobacter sp.]
MTTEQKVRCDCGTIEITTTGDPRVHAYCHCEDCRELLQVPFHSVLAWNPEQVAVTRGKEQLQTFQHPTKRMTRVFCRECGEVLYNTNAKGWKLISQLLYRKNNGNELPASHQSSAHFFYDRRIIDIDDALPKK